MKDVLASKTIANAENHTQKYYPKNLGTHLFALIIKTRIDCAKKNKKTKKTKKQKNKKTHGSIAQKKTKEHKRTAGP